jgi:pimeloyl-ACP methyl ester carboxylesterase
VLSALGLERVKLLAHDWGGWCGFLICLNHPERIERFLALNIPPPWGKTDLRSVLTLWRFWYQYLISTPFVGNFVLRNMPQFVRFLLKGTSGGEKVWSDEELEQFIEPLREPERAHATVQLYRTFLLREFPSIARGRYNSLRLTTPTLLLFGEKDFAISPEFLRGYEQYVDEFQLELVPDCGHFIAEQRPELVNQQALEFFGAVQPADSPAATS